MQKCSGSIKGLLLLGSIWAASALADETPDSYGFGRDATAQEIAAWDIDIKPDGEGLPDGSGTVAEGESLYAAQCWMCHGKTGVEGPNDRLVVHSADEQFPDASDAETWRLGHGWRAQRVRSNQARCRW